MFQSTLVVALLFSFTVSYNQVEAFLPARFSLKSTSQTKLFDDRSDYYELLNRNDNTANTVAITSSLNPFEIEELNKGLSGSPGFVSSVPISTQAQSRKELAKMVVAAAVVYLSLNIRMKEMAEKLDYSNKFAPKADGKPIIMSNGIQYTDLTPVIDSTSPSVLSDMNIVPKRGDEMVLLAKLFYNGLHVNKGNTNLLLNFVCLEDGKYEEVYSVENANFKDVPLNGLKEAISGMKYNNRRKAIIPAYLAFGEEGLAPFVPGGAAVMYELTLTKKI